MDNQNCYKHAMNGYAAIKRKEILIHTVTLMNIKDIMLREKDIIMREKKRHYVN